MGGGGGPALLVGAAATNVHAAVGGGDGEGAGKEGAGLAAPPAVAAVLGVHFALSPSPMVDGYGEGEVGAGLAAPPAVAAAAPPAAAGGGGGPRGVVAGLLNALGIPVLQGAELEDEEEATALALEGLGIGGEGGQEQEDNGGAALTPEAAVAPQDVVDLAARCGVDVAGDASQREAQKHPQGALPPCAGARPVDDRLQHYAERGAKALRTFLENVKVAKEVVLKDIESINFARAAHNLCACCHTLLPALPSMCASPLPPLTYVFLPTTLAPPSPPLFARSVDS